MIKLLHVRDLKGNTQDVDIESEDGRTIDCSGLTLFPALIDSHVHFRTPGAEYKENWESGARAAFAGGVTTVFDMPNNTPACVTADRLESKKRLIHHQLQSVGIPLRYHLYLGADRQHLDEIPHVKDRAIGIKIFMGSSTGSLLVDDDASLNTAFRLAAESDQLVSVHAEDEKIIREHSHQPMNQPSDHSVMRPRSAAIKATKRAIALAEKYGTRLCILHLSTKEELAVIRDAKSRGVSVYAEAAPHHLFLNDNDYQAFGNFVKMNPPLRTSEDNGALWEAINDGTIDFIGTDHAPHTVEEKNNPCCSAPAGVPSIELYFPLLLNAYNQGMISLEKIVELTRTNIEKIFRLTSNDDCVLVDLNKEHTITNNQLRTRCRWSPYEGRVIKGVPVFTIGSGFLFTCRRQICHKR